MHSAQFCSTVFEHKAFSFGLKDIYITEKKQNNKKNTPIKHSAYDFELFIHMLFKFEIV